MSSGSRKKLLHVMTSDGEKIELDEDVALQFQTIKYMIEDDCANSTIPLPNVTSKTLSKVIEYCKYHTAKTYESNEDASNLNTEFDKKFVEGLDQDTLFDIILAANYLDIKSLLDLTCKTVAAMMDFKTPAEIREIFHIKNDYTPEQEEEIRMNLRDLFGVDYTTGVGDGVTYTFVP